MRDWEKGVGAGPRLGLDEGPEWCAFCAIFRVNLLDKRTDVW